MFIAALFTVAKTWKQPKSPSVDDLIKLLGIYTLEYYLGIKKGNFTLGDSMDGPRDHLFVCLFQWQVSVFVVTLQCHLFISLIPQLVSRSVYVNFFD